ncbi:MAG: carbohydrate-binding family 9-like protein [Flavobacteriaceae bacterium]|nr:carbohydrate-binding family 9-like protein [Flavobacteriaceae bacterium]
MRFFCHIMILVLFFESDLLQAQNSILNDTVIPKQYVVYKTDQKLQIDGVADESPWEKTDFTTAFIDIEGIKKPDYETKVKMLWDDQNLYVYAVLEEPHLWGNLKQRDTVVFYNNDFEIFIDPTGDTYNYGEIEINVLGTLWDLKLDKPYKIYGKPHTGWDIHDIKYAVHTVGTINDPSDTDRQWSVEFAIPLSELIALKEKERTIPVDGEQWRINFSRVEWEHDIVDGRYYRKQVNGQFLPEHNWVWSNQKVINMHEPEKWGYIQFSDKKPGSNVSFAEDKDLLPKQLIYALFRKNVALLKKNPGQLRSESGTVESAAGQFHYEVKKTKDGFDITLKDSRSEKNFNMSQNGLLKQ